jgi:hypothetical protein
MNAIQEIIQQAILDIKELPKEHYQPKWRSTVIKNLEENIGIASLAPNPNHPHNEPIPEPPLDLDKPINLDDIKF